MLSTPQQYTAKPLDSNGFASYTTEENETWAILMARQTKIIQERACDEFIQGLKILNLPIDHVPQCKNVSRHLYEASAWVLEPVPALIPFGHFFSLLAERRFPAANFIRIKEELDYLKEPDIFHEIFGHCPMLTLPKFADFVQMVGQLGVDATHKERILLARLFWFTVEFGLVQTKKGLRVYGGGILSSISETPYSLESESPNRRDFDLREILDTDYKIDKIQKDYFILNDFTELYSMDKNDLMHTIKMKIKENQID